MCTYIINDLVNIVFEYCEINVSRKYDYDFPDLRTYAYDFPNLCRGSNAESILERKNIVRVHMIDDLVNIVFEYCKINILRMYGMNYNALRIMSGMSGLCYSN